MQLVVDKTLVEYSDVGTGTPLVCLHGWMMNKESFADMTTELRRDLRVISIDLPNFGASQNNETIVSVADYAQFVASFLAKLEIDQYDLAGHSMGGQIAMYGVGTGVLHPKRLILMAASGVRDERKVTKLFLASIAKLFGPAIPVSLKQKFYAAIGSDYEPGLSAVHKKIITKLLNTDVQDQAAMITIPTLLLYGSLDASTPVYMAEKLQKRMTQAKLVVLDKENHWLQQTSPVAVAREIRNFTS